MATVEILDKSSISLFSQQSVDVMGLTGLDRLFSFMIVQQLQEYVKYMERVVTKEKSFLDLKTLAEANLMPVDRLTCEYFVSGPNKLVNRLDFSTRSLEIPNHPHFSLSQVLIGASLLSQQYF